jgi:flavin-dependent dehydrogenase
VRAAGSPLVRGRVLVAGDAAGLLEPWTREGISFALRSGALAGAAAANSPATYPELVARAVGPEMAAGRRAHAAFSRHPRLVHEVMRSLPGMWGLFSRLVGGQTSLDAQLERRSIRALVRVLGG